jgi:hypothetical protein
MSIISYYELKNVVLAHEYTKSRKVLRLQSLRGSDIPIQLITKVLDEVLDGETQDAVLDRFESEDRLHWITHFSKLAASDLLTLGKVQPETMVQIINLPKEDFEEVIKNTTVYARSVNDLTIEVERNIQINTVPSDLL